MAGKSGLAFFFAHGLGCGSAHWGWELARGSARFLAHGHGCELPLARSVGWKGAAVFAYGHGCGYGASEVSIFSYGSGKGIRVIWLQHRIVFAYGPRVSYSGAGQWLW